MPRHLPLLFSIIAVGLGFLTAQQIRTVSFINHTVQMQEGQTLSQLVMQAERGNLQAADRIRADRARLVQLGGGPNLARIHRLVARVRPLAALTPVTGSGVQVVLHDAAFARFPNEPAALKLIHDQYVLRVVALLSVAGARAIAINGQRYTATTSIYCAGPTIRINDVPYASPFVVDAVGPPAPMMRALQTDPDILGWSQLVYIHVRRLHDVEIAPYNGLINLSLAKPVKIGG
ncbi:MAG: hypothetical protein C7B45_13850 [Sulfobacillus acidophilus]|uniref:DUF881 domain-containing protein n=1 Tax=Sulfobacillus acidophilus TaxID=53633 RepID=A0A2T2WEK1_9FIRM|nr:MAG: hypothetical protein C7B45_13850 [Sulfobacillus acidophilus]